MRFPSLLILLCMVVPAAAADCPRGSRLDHMEGAVKVCAFDGDFICHRADGCPVSLDAQGHIVHSSGP
jgi:hypothetical protein